MTDREMPTDRRRVLILATYTAIVCGFTTAGNALAANSWCSEASHTVQPGESNAISKPCWKRGAKCTLRNAIHSANECSNPQRLRLVDNATYVFDKADSDWPDDGKSAQRIVEPVRTGIIIEGNGATLSVAKGVTDLWYFEVEAGASLEIRDLTIQGSERRHCRLRGGASALLNHGRAVLRNVQLIGHNTCSAAGAISSDGDLDIDGSVFRNNRVNHRSIGAAAISAGYPDGRESIARLQVTDTLFEANWSVGDLAGASIINCYAVPCKLIDSTVSGNTSNRSTIYIGSRLGDNAQLLMINTTVSDNGAAHTGGIEQLNGRVTIENSTFAGNVASVASVISNECCARIQVLNSAFSAPDGPAPVCKVHAEAFDVPRSGMATDASCGSLQTVEDLQLEPLEFNGGATPTRLPRATSPLIDAGTVCGDFDQRGVRRPLGAACDVGSVEAR